MPSVKAKIQEEQWTSTMIKTAFVFQPPTPRSNSASISIDFPLLNLGWIFALSLTPKPNAFQSYWHATAFSFRQRNSLQSRWQNTSICAKLSLEECTGDNLATMNVVLADNPGSQVPLAKFCIPSQPNKVRLTVTISDCPLPNGLFDARSASGSVNEAEVPAKLVTRNVLSRSHTTGKFIDVKFVAPSTCPPSGNTGGSLPTYALLSVLGEHFDLSSSVLGESWTNALASLHNPNAQRVAEILSPEGHEYDELDSDFEDEDLAAPKDTPHEGQQSEGNAERSSSPLSSFEPVDGASDRGSTDNLMEELVRGSIRKESPTDYERTISIKFAAHKTWHAFLWYCYTGDLRFRKLRSQVEPGSPHIPLEDGPPACSPKSMYRLADLLGNQDLKAKALAAIKERMTEANVLDETFSIFTSRYPDVRNVQLGVLKQHHESPVVKTAFLRTMEKYSSMPHAEPVLSAFYDNLLA